MGFNVLVVDDSAVMRRMLVKALRMSGVALAEVHEATNGWEALEVVRRHWIDLALVDINMPVMNGETFVDEVRRAPRRGISRSSWCPRTAASAGSSE